MVMNNGKVVEQGTHEELIRAGGLYYSMWMEQASHMEYDYDTQSTISERVTDT